MQCSACTNWCCGSVMFRACCMVNFLFSAYYSRGKILPGRSACSLAGLGKQAATDFQRLPLPYCAMAVFDCLLLAL